MLGEFFSYFGFFSTYFLLFLLRCFVCSFFRHLTAGLVVADVFHKFFFSIIIPPNLHEHAHLREIIRSRKKRAEQNKTLIIVEFFGQVRKTGCLSTTWTFPDHQNNAVQTSIYLSYCAYTWKIMLSVFSTKGSSTILVWYNAWRSMEMSDLSIKL